MPARRSALTDLPYLLITLLNGLLSLQFGLLEIGLPLWVVRSTHAPRLTVSAFLVLNTAMVVVLQVRASRGTEDPQRAARICRRAGLLLAVACAAYGYAQGMPALPAVAMLLFGAVAQTIAELLSSAAGWALSYDLADQSAHGAYQGVFNSGFTAGVLLAPLVVTSTAIRFGAPGWLALGAIFALAGSALVPATRWALRSSARTTIPTRTSPAQRLPDRRATGLRTADTSRAASASAQHAQRHPARPWRLRQPEPTTAAPSPRRNGPPAGSPAGSL
jgi:MFS family permease